jgi:hypothetical protein
MAVCARGEILVSATALDLMDGSGLAFEDAGHHELKGIQRGATLCRVARSVPRPQNGFVAMSHVIAIRLARPITSTSSGRSAALAAASSSSLFGVACGSPGLGLRT